MEIKASKGYHGPGSGTRLWLCRSGNSKNMKNLERTLSLERLEFQSWFHHFFLLAL